MNRYAVSDLHGQLDLFNQIKEYINEDDVVYALGDFGDRGPEPWRTLQAVLDDKQFVYLMGNHDLMLVKAIEQYLKIPAEDRDRRIVMYFYGRNPIAQLSINGGIPTLKQWSEEPESIRYYKQLQTLPLQVTLPAKDMEHFIYLSHAGFTPGQLEGETVEDFVWDRLHFYDRWDNPKNHLVIGGHTPISVMVDRLPEDSYILKEYLIYDNGSKINIDWAAYYTGKTVLLNIDTLEAKIFTTGVHN